MTPLADPLVFWGVLGLQTLGLMSMVLIRMPQAMHLHSCCRMLFFACMFIVGLATIYAMGCHSSCWAWYGTTFSLMAVGGTVDLGSAARVEAF